MSVDGDSCAEPAQVPRPVAGPQRLLKRELIDAKSGHAVRFRNVAVSPLALAHHRGQLENPKGFASAISGDDRLHAGEQFERHWAAVHASDVRGSRFEVSTRTSDGLFWTEMRQHASEEIARIGARMAQSNFAIVRNFCGEGLAMAESLRGAGIAVHPDGTAYRLREALDDLVRAMFGAPLKSAPIRAATLGGDAVLGSALGR